MVVPWCLGFSPQMSGGRREEGQGEQQGITRELQGAMAPEGTKTRARNVQNTATGRGPELTLRPLGSALLGWGLCPGSCLSSLCGGLKRRPGSWFCKGQWNCRWDSQAAPGVSCHCPVKAGRAGALGPPPSSGHLPARWPAAQGSGGQGYHAAPVRRSKSKGLGLG